MKNLPWQIDIFRNAPDAAAAAAGAAAPGAASPPAAGAVPGAAPAAAPGAAPPAAGTSAAPAADYWPEGLDQTFKGTDAKTTLDNLAGALKGYRDRDAGRDIVKTVEEMFEFDKIKDFKIDAKLQPHFDVLKTDPVFKPMAEVAIKEGVGRGAVMRIYQAGLTAMSEAGLLEMPVNAEAERAALVPDAAKSLPKADQDIAVEKRMKENYDFLTLAQTTMGLAKDDADYTEMMLGDSAKGHRFLEWMRGRVQAGGQGPGAHGQGGAGDTREGLKAAMAALNRNDPDYRQQHAALEERYKKLIGD